MAWNIIPEKSWSLFFQMKNLWLTLLILLRPERGSMKLRIIYPHAQIPLCYSPFGALGWGPVLLLSFLASSCLSSWLTPTRKLKALRWVPVSPFLCRLFPDYLPATYHPFVSDAPSYVSSPDFSTELQTRIQDDQLSSFLGQPPLKTDYPVIIICSIPFLSQKVPNM